MMSLLSQFRFKPLQANVDSYCQSVTLIKLPEQAVRGSIKKVESGTQLNVDCELPRTCVKTPLNLPVLGIQTMP